MTGPSRYADAADSSKETRDKLERFGIADQVQGKGYRNKPLSAKDRRRNDAIAVIRAGGERPFATYKSRYGLARARFMGLAKNMTALAKVVCEEEGFWLYHSNKVDLATMFS